MLHTPVTELTGARLITPLQFPVLEASWVVDKGTRLSSDGTFVVDKGTWFSSDGTCVDVPFFLGTFPPFRAAPAGIPCLLLVTKMHFYILL